MSFPRSIVREVPSQLRILTPLLPQVADHRAGAKIRLTLAKSGLVLIFKRKFSLSLIALQRCACFCCVHIRRPFPGAPPPSRWVITGRRAERSAFHSRLSFRYLFCAWWVWTSALLSVHPTRSFPAVPTSPLSRSLSLFMPRK